MIRGGMEWKMISSEYGHGDIDEESVDDSEQSEQNTDDEMVDDSSKYGHGDTDEESVDDSEHSGIEDDISEYGHGDTDEESVDDSEQSEYMNSDQEMNNEIVNRAPTTSVFKSINTSTYPSRILKKGTRAPNKVYVYADGRVRCSGEDVNGN